MTSESHYSEISTLIDLGRRKGFLLYDEVNDLLPAEITAPEESTALLERITAAGILLSDEPVETAKGWRLAVLASDSAMLEAHWCPAARHCPKARDSRVRRGG